MVEEGKTSAEALLGPNKEIAKWGQSIAMVINNFGGASTAGLSSCYGSHSDSKRGKSTALSARYIQ